MAIEQEQTFNPETVFARYQTDDDAWHHEWRRQLDAEIAEESYLHATINEMPPLSFNFASIQEAILEAKVVIATKANHELAAINGEQKQDAIETPSESVSKSQEDWLFEKRLDLATRILNGETERQPTAGLDFIEIDNVKYDILSDDLLTIDDVIVAEAGAVSMLFKRLKVSLFHKSMTQAEKTELVIRKAAFRREIRNKLDNNEPLSPKEAKERKAIIRSSEEW
jgi:hypothetical protein